jgi:hypothetical protein
MPIPDLDENGLLPFGIHQCTLDEIEARFGRFQSTDRRPVLMRRLRSFVTELQTAGIVRAIVIDGSFVTSITSPNDIDILLVVAAGHDFRADLTPTKYLVVDRRRAAKYMVWTFSWLRKTRLTLRRSLDFSTACA